MPIYAYKCETCGHAKDVLQKMSDPLLTDCPACGNATFKKQLTAAGFQLKGTGWYVTDFREGAGKNSALPTESKVDAAESTSTTAAPMESKNAPSATDTGAAVAKTAEVPKPAANTAASSSTSASTSAVP